MSLLSSIAGIASGAGNVLGSLGSSALQYWHNKDLMGYANNLNRKNLLYGPSIQRQGLEKAGYNPLLALSGFTSGLPSVSPMPSSLSDLSSLGSSAFGAMKWKAETDTEKERKDVVRSEVDVNKAMVDVKKSEKRDLDKSAELKEALKNKADADATRSKVETVVEPVRALSAVSGSVATAYGAKKVYDALKRSSKSKAGKVVDIPLQHAHFGSRALETLGIFGLPAIPAAAAWQLNRYLQKVSPSARKIVDNPNFGSRLR